jgi:type I restriction enzyme M protein
LQNNSANLRSRLWEAANILRGSAVDRTDWKGYILPLLFFKRISDVWDEEHVRMLDQCGEDFIDEHRFQIPDGCHFDDLRSTAQNVGARGELDVPTSSGGTFGGTYE